MVCVEDCRQALVAGPAASARRPNPREYDRLWWDHFQAFSEFCRTLREYLDAACDPHDHAASFLLAGVLFRQPADGRGGANATPLPAVPGRILRFWAERIGTNGVPEPRKAPVPRDLRRALLSAIEGAFASAADGEPPASGPLDRLKHLLRAETRVPAGPGAPPAAETAAEVDQEDWIRSLRDHLPLYLPRGGPREEPEPAAPAPAAAPPRPASTVRTTWIEFKVVWADTGEPVPDVRIGVKNPGGTVAQSVTDSDGLIRIEGLDPGACEVSCGNSGPTRDDTLSIVGTGAAGPRRSSPAASRRRRGLQRILDVERHKVRKGESLAGLAGQAGITWQDLSRFNWGTTVPAEINRHLREDVGCSVKTADGNNYRFDDSDTPGIVLIPRPWEADGFATATTHVFRVLPLAEKRVLESTFALDQFTGLARHLSEHDFWAWVVVLFGFDIDIEATRKLRRALRDGQFDNPPIRLVPSGEMGGHLAGYLKEPRVIRVADELVDAALADDGEAGKLMVALVEEFGHHVDVMLRYEYSAVKPGSPLPGGGTFADDAPFDEGAAFAHAAVLLDYDRTTEKHFATLIEAGARTPLILRYAEVSEAVRRYAGHRDIEEDDKTEFEEYFGAGEPKVPAGMEAGHCFTHMVIEEKGLGAMPADLRFKNPYEVKRVYFGNWERDLSQVVDPKLTWHPEHNSLMFKRSTLTKIVDVLARSSDAFGNQKDFLVTPANLGVYRPEEHIDNPHGITDASMIDPAFRKACTNAELEVDPVRGMKNYIASEGRGWATSSGFIRAELTAAKGAGRTPEGMRRFGNGYHTLEDFFAHSNFVELALRKVGFAKVDPWVPIPAGTGKKVPLVTGSFGALDTAASILLEVGEILQKTDPFAAGERSKGQKILLILMEDKYPNVARYYDAFLRDIENFKRDFELFYLILHKTVGQIMIAIKFVLGLMIRAVANQIDEAQTAYDENSTNPTHTQIAKDHYDHHFHELAAALAVHAVTDVGTAMAEHWAGRTGTTPPAGGPAETEDHFVKTGEGLVSIAAKHGITWQKLAELNWGTSNPRQVNRFLYEEVGCREPKGVNDPVDELANYHFSSDDHRYGTGRIRVPKKGDAPGAPGSRDPVNVALSYLVHPEDTSWMDGIVKKWGDANRGKVTRGESRTWVESHAEELRKTGEEWSKDYPYLRDSLEWLELLGKKLF